MAKDSVAVLNVNSKIIQLIAGKRGLNKTFIVESWVNQPYDGFGSAKFFVEDKTRELIKNVIKKANAEFNGKIDELYVGVPSEFVTIKRCRYQLSFKKRKRITHDDVQQLYELAYSENTGEPAKYRHITHSAVGFELSDSRRTSSPAGAVSDYLKGELVYYLASLDFLNTVDKALKEAGVAKPFYYPVQLAEVIYLFEPYERDRPGILIDVDQISTSLSLYLGDGMLYMGAVSLGSGDLEVELSRQLSIPYSAACVLKKMLNISFNPYERATYDFEVGSKLYSVLVSDTNEIVKNFLDELSHRIHIMIAEGQRFRNDNIRISLTGSGICDIRGAKDYISSRLGHVLDIVAPKVPVLGKPYNSAALSLFNMALEQKHTESKK